VGRIAGEMQGKGERVSLNRTKGKRGGDETNNFRRGEKESPWGKKITHRFFPKCPPLSLGEGKRETFNCGKKRGKPTQQLLDQGKKKLREPTHQFESLLAQGKKRKAPTGECKVWVKGDTLRPVGLLP